MTVRLACAGDIGAVAAIYERIHDAEEKGELSIGWARGVYPTAETARLALARGDLFVLEDEGRIAASAIINRQQVDVYAGAPWSVDAQDHEVLVLHTLCVDPLQAGRGTGTRFVHAYEEMARAQGCRDLRMDTNEKNARARALYQRLGYREIGIVPCVFNGIAGVYLVLLEKPVT